MRPIIDIPLAAVWLIMGLGCKVLGWTPRHQEIVARILGGEHAREITVMIGLGEIGIAAWILSGIRSRVAVYVQVALVAVMNAIEFLLARDLLLFGAGNLAIAAAFIAALLAAETRRPSPCSPH